MLSFEEFDFELMRTLDEKYPEMKKRRRMRYRFNEIKMGIVLEGPNGIEPIVYPDNLYEAYKEMEDRSKEMRGRRRCETDIKEIER